jgi:hypothetical protein
MPRDYRPSEKAKKTKARQAFALARNELRGPSEPREAPAGTTSFPVKKINVSDQQMIDAFLAKRRPL